MFNIILFEPEIPPNTGNIIRLCANSGCNLHLIHPLGFELEDKQLRRAGLDYSEWANVQHYENFEDFETKQPEMTLYPCTTKASKNYCDMPFKAGDGLLFGPESRGLPVHIREKYATTAIRIPMVENSRSINLANAVSIILFEAWRQNDFVGGKV